MCLAVGTHSDDIERILEAYEIMSQKYCTHSSATLFNSGTVRPQVCSCYMTCLRDDAVESVFDTLTMCAQTARHGTGVAVSIYNHGARGAYIPKRNGRSAGLVPMLRTFDAASRYINQGAGKRPGAIKEPWHADFFEFLDIRKNNGKE